ncbi:PaaI family thioesterase [Candidatus Nephthysia bennettiae]|uniref:PaaI family thioesterase n=1 Tax=Candidatus Nephthysia bennettiae TaxID=3127016 RepID=A0A934K0Q4_9BACT|nr:PaaI family thioesterase [Candidatus Dormibacteraeota bacterium]MBJ7611900.1 PaaI family thioesterase [Candidatus Dormibacteraeota bacterium]
MSEAGPIWREPVRGFYADPHLLARPGLAALEAFSDGHQLPPPIHYLSGLTFEAAAAGTARFSMPASRWLLSAQGLISGATLALLVDGPLGCAVQTRLPQATPYSTAELSLSFLRPVNDRSGVLVGTARSVHAGRTVGLAEADVIDGGGRRVAVASTRCAVLPRIELPEGFASEPLPEPVEPAWDTPHPYLRPAVGAIQPQEVFDRLSGLDVLGGCVSGQVARPPLAHLFGVRPVSAEAGSSEWTMPASEWLCAPVPGRLYGGATAMIAGLAVEGSIETTVPAGTAFATVDLKVYFVRPVMPDGRDLRARGTVVHRGRTVAVATSEVLDADGRQVAVATGSGLLLPGRPAALAEPSGLSD